MWLHLVVNSPSLSQTRERVVLVKEFDFFYLAFLRINSPLIFLFVAALVYRTVWMILLKAEKNVAGHDFVFAFFLLAFLHEFEHCKGQQARLSFFFKTLRGETHDITFLFDLIILG